MVRIYFNFN